MFATSCFASMEVIVEELMKSEHFDAKRDLIDAILSDPCIACHDFRKRCILLTDFSVLGFGYNMCQPNDNPASLAAMDRKMAGTECEFLRPDSQLKLRTTGFGSRKTQGRENKLHLHLGEEFCLDWAIHRNRTKLYGTCFIAITDCYGLRFILSYDGPNAVILRLQMRLMLWSMDLYHRLAKFLVLADYCSRLGIDMNFDELFRVYLAKINGDTASLSTNLWHNAT